MNTGFKNHVSCEEFKKKIVQINTKQLGSVLLSNAILFQHHLSFQASLQFSTPIVWVFELPVTAQKTTNSILVLVFRLRSRGKGN